MHFLMELVKDYLQEAHPEELARVWEEEDISGRDMEEDSFSSIIPPTLQERESQEAGLSAER